MTCLCCDGDGWLRRLVPHPYAPGQTVTVTRPCTFCQGRGTVQPITIPSGKDQAANDTEGKIVRFPLDNHLQVVKQ
jgi:hypothetical protein